MTTSQFKQLTGRYLKGQTSSLESNLMDEFYIRATHEEIVPDDWDKDEKSRIKKRVYQKIEHKTKRRKGYNFRYALASVAAAIALPISGYFYFNSSTCTIPIFGSEWSGVWNTVSEGHR